MQYRDQKTKRWRWRFSFQGRRYSGTTPGSANTKAMAARLEAEHTKRVTGGVVRVTIAELADVYLAYQLGRVKPLSYEAESWRCADIVDRIGKRFAHQVDGPCIDDMVTAWLAVPLKPRTINGRLSLLRHILSFAAERGYVDKPPTIRGLKVPQDTPRFLSEGEALRLIEAATGIWRVMLIVALRTGMRIGELRGLEWGDVDFGSDRICVRRTDPGRKGMSASSPKSGKFRVVPMTPDCREALASIDSCEISPLGARLGKVFVSTSPRRRGAFVAFSAAGCERAMQAMAKRAGLDDVSWHTTRHTYASWLVMRGVPLVVVQQLLGHASIKMTERYAHLAPGFGHEQVASLDRPLERRLLKEG